MNYIIDCLAKFRLLPSAVKQKIGGLDSFLAIQEIEKKYGVDVSFALVLVAIGELNTTDFGLYLQKKNNLATEDAYDIENEVTRRIFSKFLYQEKEVTGKSALIAEFQDNLLSLLEDKDKATAFNIKVFQVLSSDGSFLNDLEKTILSHDYEIGDNFITVQEKKVKPAIANWIKDFLVFNGTDNFDNIVLARYISSSVNTKNLSEEDRILLFRALKTYHNITFFLDDKEEKFGDFPELIPLDLTMSNAIANNSQQTNSSKKKKNSVLIKKDNSQTTPSSAELLSLDFNKDLDHLNKILLKYDRNSLEYRAIKQEIDRLRKNKS